MKSLLCQLVALFLLLSCQPNHSSETSGIFSSPESITLHNDSDKLLVMIPGANLAPQDYRSLALEVQRQTSVKIIIPGFIGNFPNPLQIKGKVETAIKAAKKTVPNLNHKNVFIAGHSLGGIMARTAAKDLDVGGLILLGSYLPKSAVAGNDSLQQFPIPVLTLGGSRDGLTRMTYIAREYGDFLATEEIHAEARYSKPVILLQDINHAHFAHGQSLTNDIPSSTPTVEAHQLIAKQISAFISLNQKEATNSENQRTTIDKALQQTQEQLSGFIQAWQADQGLCQQAQTSFANLNPDQLAGISIKYQHYENGLAFLDSKPQAKIIDGRPTLEVKGISKTPNNLMDISETQISPLWISCKSKSNDAIAATFDYTPTPNDSSCQQLNEQTIAWAKSHLTETQREMWAATGKDLNTAADISYSTGVTWSASSLTFESDDQGSVTVASPALFTDADVRPANFAGMRYCVLLSASRAMEWLLVESLK